MEVIAAITNLLLLPLRGPLAPGSIPSDPPGRTCDNAPTALGSNHRLVFLDLCPHPYNN